MTNQFVCCLLNIFMLLFLTEARNLEEPVCSKYDFEEKVLERLVRLEHNLEVHHRQLKEWEDKMEMKLTEINDAEVERTNKIVTMQSSIQQELEGQQTKLGEILTNFQQQVVHLSNDLIEKESQSNKTLREFINKKDRIVFFSVNTPTHALANGVPLFSNVVANMGDGYDTATGLFTCSIPGMYHFSVTFMAYYNSRINVSCYIRHNSVNIVRAFTTTTGSNTIYQSASASTYLSLAMGDTVDLGGCGKWDKVYKDIGSMFSGALITPS